MVSVETYATIAEAERALDPTCEYLAGGTLVMRAVNYGDQRFNRIVRATDPALKHMNTSANEITLGAGLTMAEVMATPEISFLHPVARAVGGPAIRNMATIGGNLFAAHPYGDFATALLALDASVLMASGQKIAIETFFSGRETQSGLVNAVSFTRPASDAFRFSKISRVKPKGVSVMSIAVLLSRAAGRLSNVRLAFGAMGPFPLRAKSAEQALEGAILDASGIERALGVLTNDLQAQDDALASAWYRNQVAPVHLRRLLLGEGGR